MPFDASDPGDVATALDFLPSRVDVLVHSAGGNRDLSRSAPVAENQTIHDTLHTIAQSWRDNFEAIAYLISPAAGHVKDQVLAINGCAVT